MTLRLEKKYEENRQILDSIHGLEIKSAIEEQYFFEEELDKESRGTLKLKFSDGKEITFNCDSDAESISIQRGGFTDKGTLETGFKDGRYRWKEKEFIAGKDLKLFGQIIQAEIKTLIWNRSKIQNGCRIRFKNGNFLHIWTVPSDNIFYSISRKQDNNNV